MEGWFSVRRCGKRGDWRDDGGLIGYAFNSGESLVCVRNYFGGWDERESMVF